MIPQHTKEALDRWVENGWYPGGFLEAVLTNDLFGALGHADDMNRVAIFDICSYIYCELPHQCWHTREMMETWAEERQAEQKEEVEA